MFRPPKDEEQATIKEPTTSVVTRLQRRVTQNLQSKTGRSARLDALPGEPCGRSVPNQQKPWTPSDVAELRAFVDEEMTVGEIAQSSAGRSPLSAPRPLRKTFPLQPPPQ